MTEDWYKPYYTGNRKGLHVCHATLTTSDATETDIATFMLHPNETAIVKAEIIGQTSDASTYVMYKFDAGFYRGATGNITQIDDLYHNPSYESNSSLAGDVVADSTNQTIDIRVTGIASTTIYWVANIEVLLNRGVA